MAYKATAATEAHKQKLRQRLLASALQIVSKEGFSGLSINAVANASNVASGTLYRYFDNKAQLCAELFKTASQREVDQVANAARSHDDPALCLSEAIATFATRAFQNPGLAWALIAEPADKQVDNERLRYRCAYARIFSQLLQTGIEQQRFQCENPQLSAAAIVGALAESLIGPLSPAADSSQQQETVHQLQQFCLHAVCCAPLPTSSQGTSNA